MNLWYYIKSYGYNSLPDLYFKKRYKHLMSVRDKYDESYLLERLDYYCHLFAPFEIPDEAIAVKNLKNTRGTAYYLDLVEHLHYFHKDFRLAYHFGDETHVNSFPTLFKARPIKDSRQSVLFKLNKRRHFRWVKDTLAFANKKSKMVWRGSAYQPLRRDFVAKYHDHPLCDVGQTNKEKEQVPWQKPYMTIGEQLEYKFIFCPEGNDVATNLKWAMSSNSLCIMPRPTCETWFMEGSLVAGTNYIEVDADYSNLDAIIERYSHDIGAAQEIIHNAQLHVSKFQDDDLEDLLCLMVLERYAHLSGQGDMMRFLG